MKTDGKENASRECGGANLRHLVADSEKRGRKSETDARMSGSDVAGTDTALFSAWHRVCSKINESELGGAKVLTP